MQQWDVLVETEAVAGLGSERMTGAHGCDSNVLERSFLLQTKALVHRSGMKVKIQLNGVFPVVTYSDLGTC